MAGRVIGIGGIFFKTEKPAEMKEWYHSRLGVGDGGDYTTFAWREKDSDREHMTVWSPFPASSKYFDPSPARFMINYIVEDLDGLLASLKEQGVQIDPKQENYDYGRFAWIYDPDGNKIELWEPPPAK